MARIQITLLILFTVLTACRGMALPLKDYSIESVTSFVNEQHKNKKPTTTITPNTAKDFSNLEDFKRETLPFLDRDRGGGMDGGGGSHSAQEFFQVAHSILDFLREKNSINLDLEALSMAISTIEIEFTDEILVLDGIRKDAINYHKTRLIRFNQKAWDDIKGVPAKAAIVLHEILGIMKVPDKSYKLSYHLLGNTPLKTIADPSIIEAEPGSLLHSYDLLVGEMFSLVKKDNHKDKKKAVELAKTILKLFFGFSEISQTFFSSDEALIRLAGNFREIAAYDPNSNSFLRFYDGYDISASVEHNSLVIRHDIILRLEMVSGSEYSFKSIEGTPTQCIITLGSKHIDTLAKLKQLFANLLNCGKLYEIFNTDIPLYEQNHLSIEQEKKIRQVYETREMMTKDDLSGTYIGIDEEGLRCKLKLAKTEDENPRFRYKAKTSYSLIGFDLITGGIKSPTDKNLFEGMSISNQCNISLSVFLDGNKKISHFFIKGFCNSEILQKKCSF